MSSADLFDKASEIHCAAGARLKISIAKIAELDCSDDSPQVEMGLERFLLAKRGDLIERCIVNNPATAEILQRARQGGSITSQALEILIRGCRRAGACTSPESSDFTVVSAIDC